MLSMYSIWDSCHSSQSCLEVLEASTPGGCDVRAQVPRQTQGGPFFMSDFNF